MQLPGHLSWCLCSLYFSAKFPSYASPSFPVSPSPSCTTKLALAWHSFSFFCSNNQCLWVSLSLSVQYWTAVHFFSHRLCRELFSGCLDWESQIRQNTLLASASSWSVYFLAKGFVVIHKWMFPSVHAVSSESLSTRTGKTVTEPILPHVEDLA